jgi:hypothetical protein
MRFLKPVTRITVPGLKRILAIAEKYRAILLQREFQDTEMHSSEHIETMETDHARDCKLRGFHKDDEVGISYSVNIRFSC